MDNPIAQEIIHNKPPNRGYTDHMQPLDLSVMVAGAGTSGNESIAKRPANDFDDIPDLATDYSPQGDNPNFTMPPFANGKDLRVGH